ncbi:hypothetical protein [Lactiplantibacillus plantarum]|nr:hypothetical protein [Lactiplantibacillus plantarum]ETF11396.1 hypothetical protein N654_2143 [Lactiplantibacillus plantarum 4_3]EYR72252.1 hypothetical protein O209_01600 [Lactiplantibacillus plantarum WHE 92]KFL86541.1 hypothetical protein LpDm1_2687 [Lactiplantibacillus plantarum]KZU12045.1 hypothetical protein CNW10_2631 [Lactiplantibacillus plantarum]KZU51734.1 hypothetical protein Nizo2802_1979 [Lactiplantibacillus plantarum]
MLLAPVATRLSALHQPPLMHSFNEIVGRYADHELKHRTLASPGLA